MEGISDTRKESWLNVTPYEEASKVFQSDIVFNPFAVATEIKQENQTN
jgi:hypothetical protein